MMQLYKCEACGTSKKHYMPEGSTRKISCKKCGEVEKYARQTSSFSMTVNYQTMEEIEEHEINPFVSSTLEKIGSEAVAGDVKTLENLVGEQKLKETFHEEDVWLDEQMILDINK
jgi:hypothetical protein